MILLLIREQCPECGGAGGVFPDPADTGEPYGVPEIDPVHCTACLGEGFADRWAPLEEIAARMGIDDLRALARVCR